MPSLSKETAFRIVTSIAPFDIQPLIDRQFALTVPTTVEDIFIMLKDTPINKEEKRYATLRLVGNMTGERIGVFLDLEKIANRMGLPTRPEFEYGPERWSNW